MIVFLRVLLSAVFLVVGTAVHRKHGERFSITVRIGFYNVVLLTIVTPGGFVWELLAR